MLSFFTSWTLVSSIISFVQLNLAMSLHTLISYAKRRFDILRPVSMSDGRIAWTNGLNERTRAWWGNFVSETVNEEEWWRVKFSHEPKIALQIL